jgi:Lon protease-like protein
MARLLPLFPLELVVFPGAATPLHIFEARYREMVGEAQAEGTEFGIVRTIARGEENGIASTGCTVTVESVPHRYPDGRFDVITRGRRRFRIVSLDDEKPYLRGAVEYFDDEESEHVPGELLNRALEAHERLQREISLETGKAEIPSAAELTSHDLSFRLAEGIDDLDFRSLLLQSRSEPQRLRLFAEFVTGYIPRRQYVAHMKTKAPTNGSGHKGPGV